MFKLYTDAATNNNYDSAGGILIIHNKHQQQIKVKLDATNNHTAEFEACLIGFQYLSRLVPTDDSIIIYYTDSKIVYESLNKRYAKHYQNYVDKILTEQSNYSLVMNNWIADTKNEGAHHLAIQGLHNFY